MSTNEERFAEIDGYIEAMDERLRTIAQQNVTLADMVVLQGESTVRLEHIVQDMRDQLEVMGIYVRTTMNEVEQHKDDPQAHNPEATS